MGLSRHTILGLIALLPVFANAAERDVLTHLDFLPGATVDVDLGRDVRFLADADAQGGRGGAHLRFADTRIGAIALGASLGALPQTLPGPASSRDGWRAGLTVGASDAPTQVRLSWFVADGEGDGSPVVPDRVRPARRGVLLEMRHTFGAR